VALDATYARGVSLAGVRDLNRVPEPQFTLVEEAGRPVFVAPSAIDPRTGQIGFFDSRLHPEFGSVLELHSELRSRTTQITLGFNGFIPPWRTFFQNSYTYGRSRDEGSAAGGRGGGSGGFGGGLGGMGGAGASLPSTTGDPHTRDWASSDFDRRHSFTLTMGRSVRPWLEVSTVGRMTSGAPYTPLVGADINGDGARNDHAFIFDPAVTLDSSVHLGMERLLSQAPARLRECLSTQLGSVAERNSCRGPCNHTLDLRANLRPELPGVGRRLLISVDAVNSVAGVDRLLHGADEMRGWGQSHRVDPVLLYPRGFDPAEQAFRYEVNERFGTPRQGTLALRNPFQLQIQGRLTVGRAPAGQQGMMGSGRGGRGGGWMGAAREPGAAAAAGSDPAAMLAHAFPDPPAQILELRDTLSLSADQVERLQVLSDSLQARHDELRTAVEEQLATRPQAGADPMEVLRLLQPRLAEARAQVQEALREARELLTADQWARVPEEIKNPPRREFGGGGGRRP
jgi:hypothetical protein